MIFVHIDSSGGDAELIRLSSIAMEKQLKCWCKVQLISQHNTGSKLPAMDEASGMAFGSVC